MKKLIIAFVFLLFIVGCGKKEEVINNKFKIIDDTEVCAQALEEIYRDEENVYYLSCIKSGNIKIEFEDGKSYSLKEVLEKDILTIDELIDNGLSVYKEKIDE